MEVIKGFIVRFLQIIWIIALVSLGIAYAVTFAKFQEFFVPIFVFAFFGIILIIIEYLVFSEFNPNKLFDGTLNKKWKNNKIFYRLLIMSMLIGSIIGVGIKLYNDYVYNQKIAQGSDLVFYDDLIHQTSYKYGTEKCSLGNDTPTATKKELREAANELKAQKVVGLNILIKIAERKDNLGQVTRCVIYNGGTVKELAETANIQY